jgi:carbamoyltransferase
MAAILGISAFYHDSAAALLTDGQIVAAAQEERFSRRKHDERFPSEAVRFCLDAATLTPKDLDYVAFYEKPLLKFDRLLETYFAYAPAGVSQFMQAMPLWLKIKLHLPGVIRKALGGGYRRRIVFTGHHEAHAASAFFPSPYEEAAILTMDGVGEWQTATIGRGKGNRIELLKALSFPHSLGLLYSAFTYFCGFKVNSGEYKLMGLAPYGDAKYADLICEKLIDLKEDGSFRMDMQYFNYCQGWIMTSRRFDQLFGGPPRSPEASLTQREMDLAASIQSVTEEIVLRMGRTARDLTGARRLCLGGGVALNCVANGKLLRSGLFDDIWIQPASGDAGGALGAALFVHHQLLENERTPAGTDSQKGSLLGPGFDNQSIKAFLDERVIPHASFESEEDLLGATVDAMVEQKVVGWFQNRMEFGPRALGSRSIIGDARNETMQSIINLRIKHRESFRPFAPCVLAEDLGEYFELDRESPYMLLVADVRKERRCPEAEEQKTCSRETDLQKRLNVRRSDIPAVTHVDMSARIQTVDKWRNGRFWRLMKEFKRRTGCGVIINTSFNIRDEPIVCSPMDAYRCFMGTDMDVLVMENCILLKNEQPKPEERTVQLSEPAPYSDTQKGMLRSGMLNLFSEVNWRPSMAEKRRFGWNLMLGIPLLAVTLLLLAGFWSGTWRIAPFLWFAGSGLVAGALCVAIPSLAKPFYLLLHFLACCIGTVVNNALLAAFYLLVVTPVGVAMRAFGRKALHKTFDRKEQSYWEGVKKPGNARDYYRQF